MQSAVAKAIELILSGNAELQPIYDLIQEYNAQYSAATE